MPLIATDAVVLHFFDYLESSRILRLATREAGIQSVMARGARRSKSRFGPALDLYVEGVAHFTTRPGRELHTLTSFEITRARPGLATDIGRFTGAAAIAELALRFGSEEPHPEAYDAVSHALDALQCADSADAAERALAGAWSLVSALGFSPSLDCCALCDADIPSGSGAVFSAATGGLLCTRCATGARGTRALPLAARHALELWQRGEPANIRDEASVRAHQRLLREFVQQHLSEGRALRAFSVWEHERWTA